MGDYKRFLRYFRTYWHIAFFLAVSLLVALPFFSGRFVFTLDSSAAPGTFHGIKSLSDIAFGTRMDLPSGGDLGIGLMRLPFLAAGILFSWAASAVQKV